MKKLLLVSFVFIFSLSVCASPGSEPTDSTSAGKVYFMRSTGFAGSATAFTVFVDDTVVCKLNNKRFSIHEIPAGLHKFSSQFAGKKSKEKAERIEINIEAGKTYYIQLIFQGGMFVNNLYCQEVTASSANTMLPNLKQDKDCGIAD